MPTYPERRAAAIAKGVAIMRKRKTIYPTKSATLAIDQQRDLAIDASDYLYQHERAFARYLQLYPDEGSAAEFDGPVADEIVQRILRAQHESRISNGFRDYDPDTIIEWVVGRESPVLAAERPDEDAYAIGE